MSKKKYKTLNKKPKKKNKNKKRNIIIVISLVLVFLISLLLYQNLIRKPSIREAEKIGEINKYPYILYENATALYKKHFAELTDVLGEKERDDKKYAEIVVKLFIADFYDLDNKVTSTNLGGTEFIHKSLVDNFKIKAQDTIYKGIESNVYGDRKQELPKISKIDFTEVKEIKYNKNKIVDDKAYEVTARWSYKKDLSYQSKATFKLVHEGNIISIVDILE